jgi:hypothetical protein
MFVSAWINIILWARCIQITAVDDLSPPPIIDDQFKNIITQTKYSHSPITYHSHAIACPR